MYLTTAKSLLSFALFIVATNSSKNSLNKIEARIGVTQCFACQNHCTLITLENCQASLGEDVESICFSSEIQEENEIRITKGCIESTAAANLCEEINQVENNKCEVCNDELCNYDYVGARECYFCDDVCEDPLPTHNCLEFLHKTEGAVVTAACVDYSLKNGDTISHSKGCIADTSETRTSCSMLNIMEGITCSICGEDLCNGGFEIPGPPLGAEKCYSCEGICAEPMEEVICKEVSVDGADARCISSALTTGDSTTVMKGCVNNDLLIETVCNSINQEAGGYCYLCETDLCNAVSEEQNNEDENEGENDEEVLTPGVTQCFACQDQCNRITLESCQVTIGQGIESSCISSEIQEENGIRITKGCIEKNAAESYCAEINQGESNKCEICDDELCNHAYTGVRECYFCNEICEEPLPTHNCLEFLHETEGFIVNAACLDYSLNDGETISYSKGCLADTDEIRTGCNIMNLLQEGVTCSICAEELCNGHSNNPLPSTGVQKCHFCEGICADPLEEVNCEDVLEEGAEARCISSTVSAGNSTTIMKGCVNNNGATQAICDSINQEVGGYCYLCDTNLCNAASEEQNNGEEDEGNGEEEGDKENDEENVTEATKPDAADLSSLSIIVVITSFLLITYL